MSYIKQKVQSGYDVLANNGKNYLLKLKEFLTDNGFTAISEDYSTLGKENIIFQIGNFKYSITITANSSSEAKLSVIVSKALDDSTTINMNRFFYSLLNLQSADNTFSVSSTVLLVKNQNSFALVITSSENNITSSSNIVSGNIAYKLVDDTDSDISFINSDTFTAIEKSQGNTVTFRLAHSRLNDDRLVYENKVSVNQNNLFIGDSNEVIGLVGAEKGKIYQTDKGKYFAFADNIAMLMGDEIL